jgi:hypothetical protein
MSKKEKDKDKKNELSTSQILGETRNVLFGENTQLTAVLNNLVTLSFFLSLSFSLFDILAYSYRPSVQTISNCVKRVLTDRIGITGWTILQMYPLRLQKTGARRM